MVVHHHTIIVAKVARKDPDIECGDLVTFLSDLVATIGMQELFKPIAIHGKYGFTGIVGIVTSHIAFHYFEEGSTLHFDVYSCKAYDLETLARFVDRYWHITSADILFIRRDHLESIKRYRFENGRIEGTS